MEKETALTQIRFLNSVISDYRELIENKFEHDYDEFWNEPRLVHKEDCSRCLSESDCDHAERAVAVLEMCVKGNWESSLEEDEIAKNKYSP